MCKFIRGPDYKPLSLPEARKQSDTNLWLKLS